MTSQTIDQPSAPSSWLTRYSFLRFAFSAAWVALAFTVAKNVPALAAILLVAYPAWDALANLVDANHSGGLARNRSQQLNLVVSLLTAVAVAVALGQSMSAVLVVFGVWAVLSGLLQLTTAIRRWRSSGGQWVMILSGAQSALAGTFFFKMAHGTEPIGITSVAPYASVGAFYFLVSAIWLTVSDARQSASRAAGRISA